MEKALKMVEAIRNSTDRVEGKYDWFGYAKCPCGGMINFIEEKENKKFYGKCSKCGVEVCSNLYVGVRKHYMRNRGENDC